METIPSHPLRWTNSWAVGRTAALVVAKGRDPLTTKRRPSGSHHQQQQLPIFASEESALRG